MWKCSHCGLYNYNEKRHCQACFHQCTSSSKRSRNIRTSADDGILTIFEYSQLLYNSMKNSSYLNEESNDNKLFMDLCLEISFFITSPNQSIMKYESEQYITILSTYCPKYIAQLINSFIVDQSDYLKWMKFTNTDEIYQKQLHYSCNDNIVDFRNATQDFINIRTQLLNPKLRYHINVYIFTKDDEMVIGLITKDGYTPTVFPPTCKHALTYYGGLPWCTKTYGGLKTDECSGYPSNCNHGVILSNGQLIQHPLNAYSSGDWLNFDIDFPNKIMIIYKNGIKEYQVDQKYFPAEHCYFWFCVDRPNDKVFIEQSHRSIFI